MNQKTTKEIVLEKTKAGYPALYVVSSEDARARTEIKEALSEIKERDMYVWTQLVGLVKEDLETGRKTPIENTGAPGQALDAIAKIVNDAYEKEMSPSKKKRERGAAFVLRLFHHFVEMPPVQAMILDLIPRMKMCRMSLIILTPVMKIPKEIEKDFAVVETPLPTKEMLGRILGGIVDASPKLKDTPPTPEKKKELIDSAAGLTTTEAENVFALSIVRPSLIKAPIWDAEVVMEEKCSALKKTGLLEYIPTAGTSMNSVGGMKDLKTWVSRRKRAFTDEARKFGLPHPKGILMVGPPGSGKSLGAKAVGAELGLPLVRADFGKLLGSLVGQSESNMRKVIELAEAMAPCVFWIDEIEKALAGSTGHSTDSGVGARLLGTLLTWMQEKTSPVFVYATANDVTSLPPELLRKGRFDEMWSVLLPNEAERKEIFQIQLKAFGRDKLLAAKEVDHLAAATTGFSGAEIRTIVEESLYKAFDDGREVSVMDLIDSAKHIIPLSVSMSDKIQALERWCKGRARPVNGAEGQVSVETILQMQNGRVVEA